MRMLLGLLFATATTACSHGSPTGPSTPPPPPVPNTVTLSGRLTATVSGQALVGVQAALGLISTQTDGQGAFQATMAPQSAATLVLTGSSIVPRTLQVAMLTTRPLQLDAIALDSPFNLDFYRQFVRNATQGQNQPLRRWTQNPNLYLQTTGTDARTLDQIEAVARDVVPQWTNHQFAIGAVERGTDSRVGQAGWLTVTFAAPDASRCGASDVGRSGGEIIFYPATPGCSCPGYALRPKTIRHEFGHAMGYYHTDSTADVMFSGTTQCDQPLSGREAYHAAIAYSRPVGNQDPDTDPTTVVNLAPMRQE